MENNSHSISDVAIGDFHQKDYQSVIEYKAFAFLADQTKTTFNYEVKRVRAVWDPSLSIPGTDRRGGWRCPPGVRFGGQITDRFGRNCGWGIARRIANALTNVGEMVEGRDDDRRARRTAKRNARMVRRLARDEEGGRLERGLGAVADVLDGGEVSAPTPDADAPEVDVPSTPSVERPTLEELPETEDKKSGFLRSLFNGFVKDFNDRRAKRRKETDAAIERAMGLSPKEQWKEIFDAVKRHWGIGKPEEFVPETREPRYGRTDEDYARFFESLSDEELAKMWMGIDSESDGVVVNPDAKEKLRAELERRGISTDIDELVDAYGKDDAVFTGERMEDLIDLFIDDIDLDEADIDFVDPFTPSEPRPAPRPAPRPRVPSGGRSPRPRPTPGRSPYFPYDGLDRDNPPSRYPLPKRPDGISDADWRAYVRYHNSIRPKWEAEDIGGGRGSWNYPDTFEAWMRRTGRGFRPEDMPEIPEMPGLAPRPRPAPGRRPDGFIDFPGFEPEPRRPANNRRPGKFPQELPDLSDEQIGEFIDTITNKLKKALFPTPLDDIKREMGKRFGTSDISMLTSEQLDELAAWVKQKGKDIKNGKYPKDWENSQGQTFTRFASSILDVRDARNELINRGATPDENGRVHKPNWDKVNENWRERRERERREREEEFGLGRDMDREPGVYRSGGGNLRESEARRMARELRQPGAPRTDETPRARTRGASDAGAARTATRRTPATAQGDADIPSKPVTPTRRTVKPKKIKDPNKLSDQEILNEVANPETDQTMVAALTDEFNRRNSRVSLKPNMTKGNVALPVNRAFNREEMQEIIGDDPELSELLAQNDPNNPNWSIELDQAMQLWNADNLEELGQVISNHEEFVVEDTVRLERFIKQLNDAQTPAQVKMAREMIAIVNAQYAEHKKALDRFKRRKAEIEGGSIVQGRKLRAVAPQRVNAKDLNLEKGHVEIEMQLDAVRAKLTDLEREMETVAQYGGEDALFSLIEKYTNEQEKVMLLLNVLDEKIYRGEGQDILEFDMFDFNGYEGEQTLQEYRDNVQQIYDNYVQIKGQIVAKIRADQLRAQINNEYRKEPVAHVVDGGVIEPELRPVKVDRVLAPRKNPEDPNSPFLYNENNIDEAVDFIHENGGSLDDIPDEIIFEVIVDGEMQARGNPNGDLEYILNDGFGPEGTEWQNRRFEFEVIKDATGDAAGGLWQVLKVRDKISGKDYYLKKSYYARNEGMLEMLGMRAAEVLEFPNNQNRVRVGKLRVQDDQEGGRVARWVMTEASKDWDLGGGNKPAQVPTNAIDTYALDVEERDVARMAVLDLVLHNEDRHGGNFQLVIDSRGRQRFVPIDHGLLGGGRVGNDDDMNEEITPEMLEEWADMEIREFDEEGLLLFESPFGVVNNGLRTAKLFYKHDPAFPEQRARFLAVVRNATDALERELEELFSVERFEKNGLVLSDLEKAHLKALRRVAESRVSFLKQNPEALVRFFDRDWPPRSGI